MNLRDPKNGKMQTSKRAQMHYGIPAPFLHLNTLQVTILQNNRI